MNPLPIVSIVVSYLDCWDFLQVSLVNRQFYRATQDQSLWRREALRVFLQEETVHCNPTEDWKSICLRGLWISNNSDNCITQDDSILYILASPPLSLPPLRREINYFPTLIQDLIANPECDGEASLISLTEHTFRTNIIFLCTLIRCVLLEKQGIALLEEYLSRWELFSNSLVYLDNLVEGKCALYIMRDEWKRLVYDRLEISLNDTFMQIVEHERFSDCLLYTSDAADE